MEPFSFSINTSKIVSIRSKDLIKSVQILNILLITYKETEKLKLKLYYRYIIKLCIYSSFGSSKDHVITDSKGL